MRVMIAGASGFIGRHLVAEFASRGHEVVCGVRSPARGEPAECAGFLQLDYTAPDPERWARELRGVDVVINAIGIIRGSAAQPFEALHTQGPLQLFAAAATAGVRRVIQISALGAEPDALSQYHRTKHAADRALMALEVDWAVVQPSLVYGPGGNSSELFNVLATLPVIVVPGDGGQPVQPVHVDDLVRLVVDLAEDPAALHCVLPVVGPRPLVMRDFLQELRQALGLTRAPVLRMPRAFISLAAAIGDHVPGLLLTRETWGMLERGSTAPADTTTERLGRPPRDVARFIPRESRAQARAAIVLGWTAPLLRLALAAVWLIAGIVSLGPYPVERSLALLGSIGIPSTLAPAMLYGASALDIVLGIWTLLPWRPRMLWTLQFLLVLVYTAIISVFLPQLWLEPFGPVAKNLPILAILLLLRQTEARR